VLSQDEWLAVNEPERLARLAELGGVPLHGTDHGTTTSE
jgi:hypothetical protein